MKGAWKTRSFSEERDGEETLASLSACWGLTAAAWDTTDRTQREGKKKVWEWASMGFLSLYFSRPLAPPLPSTLLLSVADHMSTEQEADDKHE